MLRKYTLSKSLNILNPTGKNSSIKEKKMNKINPFLEKKAVPVTNFVSISDYAVSPYDKKVTSPYTKTRIILLNGAEFEQTWFLHQFNRTCNDNDLRREIALIRRHEQQQQKIISGLKPIDETNLETTIAYEQLAVDLTAILAKHVKDENVKKALDFALLEDFDHLYRFANLLESEQGIDAKKLTGGYTEITPGRPTVAEPRHPFDEINRHICADVSDPFTKLVTSIITAGEQQTMNFYMNIAGFHPTEIGRKLYSEIAMIEEQHVTEYGSLMDTTCSPLESWLMHEYTECYLYYSCFVDETDENIKNIFYRHYLEECGHLQHVASLLLKFEGKPWQALYPDGGDFPELLRFEGNIEYVQNVLAKTINQTRNHEDYENVNNLDDKSNFFKYQKMNVKKPEQAPSHKVIENHIKEFGEDFRFEAKKHPISELRNRNEDNINIARKKTGC